MLVNKIKPFQTLHHLLTSRHHISQIPCYLLYSLHQNSLLSSRCLKYDPINNDVNDVTLHCEIICCIEEEHCETIKLKFST